MNKTGGISPMQFIYSVGMHTALLLPLLAMPVTDAKSEDWGLKDLVLSVMLRGPLSEPAAPAAALPRHALPPGPATVLRTPLQKGEALSVDSLEQKPQETKSASEERHDARQEDRSEEPPAETDILPAINPVASQVLREETMADKGLSVLPTPETASEAPPAKVEQTAATERVEPLSEVAHAAKEKVPTVLAAVPPSPPAPAAAMAEEPAVPKAEPPKPPAIAMATPVPLPEAPVVNDYFAARDMTPVAAAGKGHPPAALIEKAGSNNLQGRGAAENKGDVKKQESQDRGHGNISKNPGRGAAMTPFAKGPQKGGTAAAPLIDLARTPGSFLSLNSPSLPSAEKPSGGGMPASGKGIGEASSAPSAPPQEGPAVKTAGGKPMEQPPKEDHPGSRLPAIPIADYAPLKIEITSLGGDTAGLSSKLQKKTYTSTGRRKEAAQEMKMRETPWEPSPAGPKMVMSVPGADRGRYAFRLVNNDASPCVFDISFLFYEGTKVVRLKQYKIVTLPGGGAATYRFLIPDAIFWDDEGRFGGSIEDSDSVTKFNDATGLIWREEKDN